MSEEYDSYDSDNEQDFEVAHTIAASTASKSVAALQASAKEDRRGSDKFEKSITSIIRQNPNTQAEHDRTWARWKVFYTNTLKQDLKTVPQAQHVRRYFIGTLELCFYNLNLALALNYPEWKWTTSDEAKLSSEFNLMLSRNEICNTKGNRMSAFSLHCCQVKMMVEAMLAEANFFGVRCWSIIIQRILCIIIQMATGTRSGDILKVHRIEAFVKFQDFKIRLVGGKHN